MEDSDLLMPGGYGVSYRITQQPSCCVLQEVKYLYYLKITHPTPRADLLDVFGFCFLLQVGVRHNLLVFCHWWFSWNLKL